MRTETQVERRPPVAPAAAMDQAYVDLGSIVCAPAGLGDTPRSDVLNSTLLAQLVADKAAKRTTSPDEWWKSYVGTLSHLAWTRQSGRTSSFTSPRGAFLVEDVVLTGGFEAPGLLAAALVEFRLRPADDPAVQVFDCEVVDAGTAHLQVLSAADTDARGNPRMVLVDVAVERSDDRGVGDVLVDALPTAATSCTVRSLAMQQNTSVYARMRESVIEKLGDHVETDIHRLAGELAEVGS